MVKLRKYNRFFIQFIVAFSVFLLISCGGNKYYNSKIEGKQIGITAQSGEVKSIDAFVAPYREHINKDLDNVLAYAPETLDKSKGEWQTTIGNLMADMTIEMGNPVFLSREKKRHRHLHLKSRRNPIHLTQRECHYTHRIRNHAF
jgi:hypothetical protein